MALTHLDLPALRRWLMTARADVAAYEDDLNRLNVFPVPDSDTGTNMLVTIDGALAQVKGSRDTDLGAAAERMSRAMLVNARGNSGIILSQLARGIYDVTGATSVIGAPEVVDMLQRANGYAWAGVSRPLEGTVLTVARAAAEGARSALDRGGDLQVVVDDCVTAASAALVETTEILPALHDAGVVDAGGAGLLLVLEALQRVVQGEPGLARSRRGDPSWLARWFRSDAPTEASGGPAYEVMFLLDKTSAKRTELLRGRLTELGDSVVVAGGPKLWSVHVHTDDVTAALNAGVESGRPHAFRVTRFADQGDDRCATRVVVLAFADGAGMTQLVRDAGARPLPLRTDGGAERALMRTIQDLRAQDVVLLGARREVAPMTEEVAGTLAPDGIRVHALASPTSAHVLAALAAIRPDGTGEEIVSVVKETLGGMHAATISFEEPTQGRFGVDPLIAVVDAEESGRDTDPAAIVTRAVQALLAVADAPELATVVRGAGVPDDLVSHASAKLIGLQTQVLDGGSTDVALTIGVE